MTRVPTPGPIEADLCVVGAGAAGLSVAAGAAQMGARVVLVEAGEMGGECLNSGCVPSKALIEAARVAETMRRAAPFGLRAVEPEIDPEAVAAHLRETIARIAPVDSQERFEGLGVTVLRARARFTGPDRLSVEGTEIRARRFVVATGSRPAVPPIPGLADAPYLTNETLFGLTRIPRHLVILGGGPIGAEMAQAHRRLGARVTIVEQATLLGRDDPDLVAVIRARLAAEGVAIEERTRVLGVTAEAADGIRVSVEREAGPAELEASHLLVAAGRAPVVDTLDLDRAGIAFDAAGIRVDRRLRTSNRRVYALGDVIAGAPRFTHAAGYQAGIVLRNALFRLPSRTRYDALPHVTYTDPELAQVGLTEAEARARHGASIEVLTWPFAENDRAVAARETEGLVKLVVGRRGRVLGAGIAGARAGELLLPWIPAVSGRLRLGDMVRMVLPYPTLGEAGKRAAGAHYAARLFSARTRRVVGWLLRLP